MGDATSIRLGTEIETQLGQVLARISSLPDEDLDKIYGDVKRIGHVAWVVECAVLAEQLSRAVKRRGGRSQTDDAESGRLAEARKIGAAHNLTPRAVFQAEAVYNEFFKPEEETVENVFNKFETAEKLGKSMFLLATQTPNPKEFIQQFEAARDADPDFSVRDAKKMVAAEKAPALDDAIWDGMGTQQRAIWADYQRAARGMVSHFPHLRLSIKDHFTEVCERLADPKKTVREMILHLVEEGHSTREDIADSIGKPRDYVEIWLGKMVAAGELVERESERKPGARGAVAMLYFLPKNKNRKSV